jgi:H+-translocating NAD(P) transhydrogenase subunit alpha
MQYTTHILYMKIVALTETAEEETRVAITPETAKAFISDGHAIYIEQGAGLESGFLDEDYIRSGAKVESKRASIIEDADIILKVQAGAESDLKSFKAKSVMIGLLSPYFNKEYLANLSKNKIDCIAMELMPRITKTQNMDVLSSQSNLAGYRAVIEAVYHFNRGLSMMMTAAGTLAPAKILILGVGVAGLAAIATAKRLGASVFASDIRKSTKEQVESLGGKFLSPANLSDMEDKTGYAKAISSEEQKQYSEFLNNVIKDFDIIITTAQIPGKQAPILITSDMIKLLKQGSVVVDMNVSSGGNVAGSKKDEIIDISGVKIIGWSNLAARISHDSSKLYAKNLYNFVKYFVSDNKCNFEDEVVKQLLVVKDGALM